MEIQHETILVIEDAPDFQLMVKAALERHYRVTCASSLQQARVLLAQQEFQLLILDVNLPDGDGFKFCAEIRAHETTRSIPVVFLTGRAELEDKLKGFSLGADDYIVKPFDQQELRARVEAKLMRERERGAADGVFVKGAIRLEIPTQRAYVVESENKKSEVGLTPIEFKILYHLARNENKVVSREQLLTTVWGNGTHVFDRATDKHVSSLRHKLGPCASYIETVSRVGYRFIAKSIA